MAVSLGDVFWFVLALALILMWLQRRLLERARARMIRHIERQRGSRLILLIHRQETVSLLGIPFFRYIDINDAEQVIRAIHLTDPDVPLDIVLQTPGGLVLASIQIARAMQAHHGKVTVHVPHYAMSGGTLLALAADEIVMDCHAVLGPVDPQLGGFPVASLIKAAQAKDVRDVDDKTLILADIGEKAVRQIRQEVLELLEGKQPRARAEALANQLTTGRWTHDHPIGFREALALGLPVRSDLPKDFYRLMDLYPQPMRRQPSVQYIPVPYGPREPQEKGD